MRIRPSSTARCLLLAALLLARAAAALAQRDPWSGAPLPLSRDDGPTTPSPITDRFYIEGMFRPFSIRTGVRLDPRSPSGAAGPLGTTLSAERDLGLLSHLYQGRIEAMLRLRERSRVRMDFEDVSRSASQRLTRQIQFGDVTFLADRPVDASLLWREFTLTYTYSVYRTDRLEIGTGLAVHFLEAQAHVDATDRHQDESFAHAYPTIPVDVTWRFARRFSANARAQYLGVSIGSSSGSLLNMHGDVQYRWNTALSVGAGYTLERVVARVAGGSGNPGVYSLDMRGAEAFFRVSF